MKIIFVCTKSITFNTFLKSQASYFSKMGFKINVACSDIENLKLKKKTNHLISFPLSFFDLINILKYIKIFFQIKNLVKTNKSNIFYLHTPVASFFFRFFSMFYDLKIIYFVHGFRFTSKTNFFQSIFFKAIENILSFKNKIIITINNEDYHYAKTNLLHKVPTYKINGVGLNLKKIYVNNKINYKNEIKKIIVIAAYKNSKGYLDLIKLAEILNSYFLKIDCYGYGDYKKYQSLKIKKKLTNITFKKFDKNLKRKIKSYDLLLHLSKREGLPVSVMECLYNGLPVICYEIRGNKDLIIDGYNGFFVKSYKDVPNRIFYLNLEKSIFYKMRINAFNSISKNFSNAEINSKICKIIKKNFII